MLQVYGTAYALCDGESIGTSVCTYADGTGKGASLPAIGKGRFFIISWKGGNACCRLVIYNVELSSTAGKIIITKE